MTKDKVMGFVKDYDMHALAGRIDAAAEEKERALAEKEGRDVRPIESAQFDVHFLTCRKPDIRKAGFVCLTL